jgi:hypothetical protein
MRHPGQLKSLSSLLKQRGSHLDTLKLEAEIQSRRAAQVTALLSSHLQTQVTPGDLHQGLLTVYVPSAALASELRFEERRLVQSLRDQPLFRGLRRIQVRVRPPIKSTAPDAVRHRDADPEAARTLNAFADTLEDEELKRRFQQLATRVSGNRLRSQN